MEDQQETLTVSLAHKEHKTFLTQVILIPHSTQAILTLYIIQITPILHLLVFLIQIVLFIIQTSQIMETQLTYSIHQIQTLSFIQHHQTTIQTLLYLILEFQLMFYMLLKLHQTEDLPQQLC